MKKMLIIAFDCNPYLESESLIGFNTALYFSDFYDVTVITRLQSKNDINVWRKKIVQI